MTQARFGCGWRTEVGGTAQACLPWVEHLPGGHDPPAGGSQGGCLHPSKTTGTCCRPPWWAHWSEGGGTGAPLEEQN